MRSLSRVLLAAMTVLSLLGSFSQAACYAEEYRNGRGEPYRHARWHDEHVYQHEDGRWYAHRDSGWVAVDAHID